MSHHVLRRHLSMPGLLSSVRQAFAEVPDGVRHRRFRLSDCLMSGLAMLILKILRCGNLTSRRAAVRPPRPLFTISRRCLVSRRHLLIPVCGSVLIWLSRRICGEHIERFTGHYSVVRHLKVSQCWVVTFCCQWTEPVSIRRRRFIVLSVFARPIVMAA